MLGKKIQEKRKEIGLTQAQLAERLGVTAPAVNRWEKDLCYPDATLLAPLARCLKTDLNELFSYYELLSDVEREAAVSRACTLYTENGSEEMLLFVDEMVRNNLSDGKLFFDLARSLWGLTMAVSPSPAVSNKIAELFERAMELLPEKREEISYSLLLVYSSLGDSKKAEEAWQRLEDKDYNKKRAHWEMLQTLKNYEDAVGEIETFIYYEIKDLSADLSALQEMLKCLGDESLAALADEKRKELCETFGMQSECAELDELRDYSNSDQKGAKIVGKLLSLIEGKILFNSDCPLFSRANFSDDDENE